MVVLSKFMGQRIHRREDPRVITGRSTYVDDVQLPGMAYMTVLRSPHGHARFPGLDVDRVVGRMS